MTTNVVFQEALSRSTSGGFVITVLVHTDMASPHLLNAGSAEQKARWLPAIHRGELITAVAVTEPDAGSDVASIRTRARRDGDHWVIDGSKMFITNGVLADLVFVAARTDPAAKGSRGLSIFAVERGTPGFSVGRSLKKSGWLASDTAELVFDQCRVPAANLLGEEHRGFYAIMKNFQTERLALGSMAIGHCLTALDLTLRYVHDRKAFGAVLWDKQAIRQRLSMLAARVQAARQLLYHCAWLVDEQRDAVARDLDAEGADRRAGQRSDVHVPAVPRRHGLHAREPDRTARPRRAGPGHRRRSHRGDARGSRQADRHSMTPAFVSIGCAAVRREIDAAMRAICQAPGGDRRPRQPPSQPSAEPTSINRAAACPRP